MAVPETPSSVEMRAAGRKERRNMILVFVGALIALIVVAVIAGLLPRGTQTNIIANFFLTLIILCPMALCLLPFYLLLVFAVFNIGRLNTMAASGLAKANTLSTTTMHKTQTAAEGLAKRSIQFNLLFAPLDKAVFSLFDRPAHPSDSDDKPKNSDTLTEERHDSTQQPDR